MSEIIAKATSSLPSPATLISSLKQPLGGGSKSSLPSLKEQQSHNSWLLRFFESKHFDMSIAISYLFNTKEPGVQTYLCNRLFTFTNADVDFYLPQLLNIYIYCCNDANEQLIADMLNTYFRSRCSCRLTGIDFSLRCSWLLDAHINDNAKLATTTKESRVRRGLNNAIKLYKQITSERLRPAPSRSGGNNSSSNNSSNATDTTGGCCNKADTSVTDTSVSNNNGGHVNNNHHVNSTFQAANNVNNSSSVNGNGGGNFIITSSLTEEPAANETSDKSSDKQDSSSLDEANNTM
jgi:hypothetical protein